MNHSSCSMRKNVEEIARFFASKVPKETNFSNIKSRKYLVSKTEHVPINDYTSTLRDILLYNESQGSISISIGIGNNKIDNASLLHQAANHHKRNSSNILKVSKEIIKYAEPRSTPKVSVKLLPKFSSDDELSFENEDDDTSEKVSTSYKQNKTVETVKKKRSEDSLCSKLKEKLNNTDIDEMKIFIPEDFNYEQLLHIETLYSEVIKDLEIGKPTNLRNKNRIVQEYFSAITSQEFDVYSILDQQFGPSLHKMCKHFFIQEIIIFTLIYLKDLFMDVKDQILVAFKTCMFYLHQNLIIVMFLITSKAISPKGKDQFNLCMKKIQENNVWLNKNNYKKYITSNNKLTLRIVRNILSQMKKSNVEIDRNYITLLANYLKNLNKLKIEVIRDTLFTSIILNDAYAYDPTPQELSIPKDAQQIIVPETPLPPFLVNPQLKELTLVLDLDETIVHYVEDSESAYIQIRPGAELFLEEISKYYEVVVFTAAMQDDLSKLGRNIEKIIIVDNVADNYKLQPENGLNIKIFEGDENDHELDELLEDLIELCNAQVQDVREYLPLIREKMKERYAIPKDTEEQKETSETVSHE